MTTNGDGAFLGVGGVFRNKTVMTVPQPRKSPKNHRSVHFKWVNCPLVKPLKKRRGEGTGQLPSQQTPNKALGLG